MKRCALFFAFALLLLARTTSASAQVHWGQWLCTNCDLSSYASLTTATSCLYLLRTRSWCSFDQSLT